MANDLSSGSSCSPRPNGQNSPSDHGLNALPSPLSTSAAEVQHSRLDNNLYRDSRLEDAVRSGPLAVGCNPGIDLGLSRQDEERLVQLYYSQFAQHHNILVPRARFERQNYPPYLKAVVYLIGSQFTPAFKSIALHTTAHTLLQGPHDPNLFLVQALLLHAITLHARGDRVNALSQLSRASDMAIHLGLNLRHAAIAYGGQDTLLQECVRRTWWELYVVDGFFAAVHRQTRFRSNAVPLEAALPCEESDYFEGMSSPQSTTIEQMDARFFLDAPQGFSSACYRVEAIRILARVLALSPTTNESPDDLQSIDNAIRAWRLHLVDSKAATTDCFGRIDCVMLQAFAFIHSGTIILHFPRSELLLRVPSASNIECASRMTPESPTSAQHATKAIAASKDISDLATMQGSDKSPLLVCGLVFGCIVQLSACSAHGHSCLIQHRDRVALMTGELKSLGRSWPIAAHALQKLNAIAAGVFRPASAEHSNDESLSGENSLGLHDAGIDVDAMLKELSGFDLFPPGVPADDPIFDFASVDPIAL
ncbi:hypothetical protein D0859_12673 [Hortaea werneckii]|uniref:Xylanolytic transcriptional activator regulatory domain-containing protein n=2 Tax=Hortaea werneckii TaxID=91943 RepID=A0A3M7ID70_HORWE|nr:hypothetical protein D0859_12673 [Hortaea werneckii]